MAPSTIDADSFVHCGKRIRIISGSIVDVKADALVSSDDNHLSMGGGVSQAIHIAAGEEVYQEARKWEHAPIGTAVVTSAGKLPARYVIHAIVIDFDTFRLPDMDIVREATQSCLKVAEERGCRSIAMPAFGTGVGGFASQAAAEVMLETVFEEAPGLQAIEEIIFVLYQQETLLEFLRLGIQSRVRAEYEARLAEIEQARNNLAEQLRRESPYRDFPFPIAAARRAIDVFHIAHSQFTASLDCAEAILRYCGVLALANHCRIDKSQLPPILEEFRKPISMGTWGNLIEQHVPKRAQNGGSSADFPAIAPLRDYYWSNKKRFTKLIRLRNQPKAHDPTQNEAAYKALFDEAMTYLDPLMDELEWTTHFPMIYVKGACVSNADDDATDHRFSYAVQRITGDNILFRHDALQDLTVGMTNCRLYVITADLKKALGLSPFLVFASCPRCQTEEPFYLECVGTNSKEKAGTDSEKQYHSFRSDHRWSE